MDAQREALATDLARIFSADGIEASTASYLAGAVVTRATFDDLGVVADLPNIVAAVKDENADLIPRKPANPKAQHQAHKAKPGTIAEAVAAERARAATAAVARGAALAAGPNPWSSSAWKVTAQSILMSNRPDLAVALMQAAGA